LQITTTVSAFVDLFSCVCMLTHTPTNPHNNHKKWAENKGSQKTQNVAMLERKVQDT
jgi:hypothetical protein